MTSNDLHFPVSFNSMNDLFDFMDIFKYMEEEQRNQINIRKFFDVAANAKEMQELYSYYRSIKTEEKKIEEIKRDLDQRQKALDEKRKKFEETQKNFASLMNSSNTPPPPLEPIPADGEPQNADMSIFSSNQTNNPYLDNIEHVAEPIVYPDSWSNCPRTPDHQYLDTPGSTPYCRQKQQQQQDHSEIQEELNSTIVPSSSKPFYENETDEEDMQIVVTPTTSIIKKVKFVISSTNSNKRQKI